MQCQAVRRKLSAYIDGELDDSLARSVESHIGQCGKCRTIVADFKQADFLLRGLPKLDMGPAVLLDVLSRANQSSGPMAAKPSRFGAFPVLMRFVWQFMELLEARQSLSTGTLDEFGDFPPSSMGHIYFQLLDQPGRG